MTPTSLVIRYPLSIIFLALNWAILFAVCCPEAYSAVKLPPLISDNMVLQAGSRAPIWGQASPGEKVVVRFNQQEVVCIADQKGNWKAELRDLKPGGPYQLTVSGTNIVTVKNILVGEVWLCSGQSNMAMTLQDSAHGSEEIPKANHPEIRYFLVEHLPSSAPMNDVRGAWQVCTPETAKQFSAVAYYFGRALHDKLARPVGLIESAWAGTPAELWISRQGLAAQPNAKALGRWAQEVARYHALIPAWYQMKCAKWGLPSGQGVPPNIISSGMNILSGTSEPSCLFNGMIGPISRFAIAGVAWYQGESNTDRPAEYRYLLPLLIADWRAHWGSQIPFIYVQLPNYANVGSKLPANCWAEVREAQLKTLAVPNTAMVVSIDLGDPLDLHPRNKIEIGNRLALAALGAVYKHNIEYSGPLFSSAFFKNDTAVLTFTHTAGLLKPAYGNEPKAFMVAGPNRAFYPAKARVFQDKVFVVSPLVRNAVAVRYGWANNPRCNLVNGINLPASPFRTDDWPK